MTVEQTKPHRLTAKVDRWGEVVFDVACPYVLGEPRPCTLYEEAKECKEEDCQVGGWFEFGHGHPVQGCYVQYLINELGWQEAVQWTQKGGERELVLPADVAVWPDDYSIEMGPWDDGRDR